MARGKSKILIIQTAFIGDVILATPIIEAINNDMEDAKIDILIRKGNQGILENHPKVNKLWIWDKKQNKFGNQWRIIKQIRKENYDYVINLQRFASSGIFTFLSAAKVKIGFNKNPFSWSFTHKIEHRIEKNTHEVDRNLSLLQSFIPNAKANMKLYPSDEDYAKVEEYKSKQYIVIAPTSVWFTKQYPANKWVEFLNEIKSNVNIYMIGGPNDKSAVDKIIETSNNNNCVNLCGELSILQSAALMQSAAMNYVNDSAPQHIASAMNANVTALFCSTIPDFGFGPKSDNAVIIEYNGKLNCKPCGLHGQKSCPEKHFDCGNNIDTKELINRLNTQ